MVADLGGKDCTADAVIQAVMESKVATGQKLSKMILTCATDVLLLEPVTRAWQQR